MAKKKQSPRPSKQLVVRTPRRMKPPRVRGSAEKAAYTKLLLDPCNAPITPSPYGDESGSNIQRSRFYDNNTFDTEVVFWHPVLGPFVTSAANGTLASLVPGIATGQVSTGNTFRAVAGCHEVMYIGAESSRAGIVGCAVVPGALVWNYLATLNGGGGGQLDSGQLFSYFAHSTRTPVDRCAVNWFPGAGDTDWIPPISLLAAQIGAIEKIFSATHFTAIMVGGAGVGSFRYSMTGVNEINSLVGTNGAGGVITNVWGVVPRGPKTFDWEQVIAELSAKDSSWYFDTFRKLAKFGVGLVDSTLRDGLPGALGYLVQGVASGMQMGGKRMINSGSAR